MTDPTATVQQFDAAYRERARLVAYLAALHPSHIGAPDEGLRDRMETVIHEIADSSDDFIAKLATTCAAVSTCYTEQLAAGRVTWKAKAAEIEADRDRIAAVLAAIRGYVEHSDDDGIRTRETVLRLLGDGVQR